MSSSDEEVNAKERDIFEEEIIQTNVTQQRPHHRYRRGGRTATRLIIEVAHMAANMRTIAA